MINRKLGAYIAIISHKRPQNISKILAITGDATFYVNTGEHDAYISNGATNVVECGADICTARNTAIEDAVRAGVPCIQVSDDLRSIKHIEIASGDGKRLKRDATFEEVVRVMIAAMNAEGAVFGGVAVTSNALNYTGKDIDLDKLIVNDLICVMGANYFDPNVALKEDYDMTIQQLVAGRPIVRLNCYLCDFPHRDNAGGANTYRNSITEQQATDRLLAKWADRGFIMPHKTREGQISLNYKAIQQARGGQNSLF